MGASGYKVFLIVMLLAIAAGCSKEQEQSTKVQGTEPLSFKNEKYGFSFSYPSDWEEIKRDLPEKWALLDKNKNTILFVVNKAKSNDLLSAGMSQALSDLYPNRTMQDVGLDNLREIARTVKLETFNGKKWYTYGINFSGKSAESLISGTLCQEYEIIFVLVSGSAPFSNNKEEYVKLLNTFRC
ncbi:hypothetical protein HYY70_03990 [Candidatus Woesearchaeota archaeon]|nr:hypothetical protein [Candidatus Woesearchaeota archaeon]